MRVSISILAIWAFSINATAQHVQTGKEIYRANRDAIVQVYAGNELGNGFIVSPDGIIVTANHVVTTPESGFRKYANEIKVVVFHNGRGRPYAATPIEATVSDDQANFDTARLKITASGLPHVTMGNWAEIDVGDPIIVISSLPITGAILLQGIVSAKGPFHQFFGPKPTNTILFQCPIRNGFSGSPIFSSYGHVVGIEDTKVFGTSPALDNLRKRWAASRPHGSASIMGIDIGASFLELINNLDQNLISGLGSGVDILYAKGAEKAQNAEKWR
ncbi:MAG TPA: serine protease [Terriglobia bacterium]|nr:serine protease [Terriglobia bacterium]